MIPDTPTSDRTQFAAGGTPSPHPTGRRIALFLPDLRGGGAERVMLNIGKGLEASGCRIDIVLAARQGEFLADVPKTMRVVDLAAGRVLMTLGPLARYLRREQPDALISALPHVNGISALARNLTGARTRTIVTIHNTMSVEAGREFLLPAVTRLLAPKADTIVAVSEGVADDFADFARIPRDRIHVIYNPVVSDELFVKAAEPADQPWLREGEPPVILGVGRLTAQKDFPTLLHAFAIVRRQRAARLLILGQGEERPRLEALVRELGIEGDTALPGFAANPFACMSRAAVFALSSRFEGLPTVMIEALACGCPVVSTDCPSGPREILSQVPGSRLTPVGDPQALAEALLETLDRPRTPAPRQAWERFTLPAAITSYLSLIDQASTSEGRKTKS